MVGRIGSSVPPPRTSSSSHSASNLATGSQNSSSPTRPDGMPANPSGNGDAQQSMQMFAQSFMFNQFQKSLGKQKERVEDLKKKPEDDDDDAGVYGE